jgi:large subunit ribosomal protein L29
MKPSDLRDLSPEELAAKEKDVREELFNLKFQHATGQLDNTARIPHLKKDLARVKTVLREKKEDSQLESKTSSQR